MIDIHILHAGITHPSPYFYNFCNNIKKYKDFRYVIQADLPKSKPDNQGIIYFNRLKRFYDSNSMTSATKFLNEVKYLKKMGWKIVMTLHNFFPIDRDITFVDEYVTRHFLAECDLVFTLSNYLKNQIKQIYGIDAINHGMGLNVLDGSFNNDLFINYKKDKKFTFVFVGNIYPYKLINQIIENFNLLNNCTLIIAGKLPNNSDVNIEKLINNNENIIYFSEFVGDDDWKRLRHIADCFINIYDLNLPAFKYGFFPSNFINIYNTGCPCISPRHPIIEELMEEKQMYYYNFNEKNGLLNAMCKVIADKPVKLNNDIKLRYDWSKVISCFADEVRGLF